MQLNIKLITVKDQLKGVKTIVKPDYKQLGPDFGNKAPAIISALMKESAETILEHIENR